MRLAALFPALLFCCALPPERANAAWTDWLSPELRAASARLSTLRMELSTAGEPLIGHTTPEFGIQHLMLAAPPLESPFVQADLGSTQSFDSVVLVPALVDYQTVPQSAYAFPVRFRLDASDDPSFSRFRPLLVKTEEDFAQPGVAPLIVHTPETHARYLRLTVTKLATAEGRWTFALSELMAFQGNRNIALGAKVTLKEGTSLPPRWLPQNLTDGRTPFGPPIDRSKSAEFDALFAASDEAGNPAWMAVDLGRELVIDEVRLHPLHARQGADVPGFRFPAQFRVEAADDESFSNSRIIYDTRGVDFPNPGNNPVTVRGNGTRGRFVRVLLVVGQNGTAKDFALSELEIYSAGGNVSRGRRALSSGDPRRNPPRPLSLLTDGCTSFGRLLEWPEWLGRWERRQALQEEIASLEFRISLLHARVQKVVAWTALGVLLTLVAAGIAAYLRSRRNHLRELKEFRARLARDMHDEIGSNLAGIAVISEVAASDSAAAVQDLREIGRIARETTAALREMLWLVGAREESGIDLIEHLQLASRRLLTRHEVVWLSAPADLPPTFSVEARRQIFLFFKEAVTNIVRHAQATRVELSATLEDGSFDLRIRDNGRGFDPAASSKGMGLSNLRERAREIGGTFTVSSSPDGGALISLKLPVRGQTRTSA